MEILAKLGIDWKLFVAQIVNFVILLIILRRFVYRPMLAFLEERTTRIDKGLKDADLARKKLGEMERKEKEVLDQAKKEAQKMLEKAELIGKQNYEKMLSKATDDVKLLMHQSAQKMELERVKMLNEAKAQLADLIILTTEKVLREKVDAQKESELIKRHLKI
jgi:F-type H+-transporting ATPase subunit b